MAFRNVLILRKPPPGPRFARPEDRLSGCLEEPALAKAGNAKGYIERSTS
jgi:hypothetical protein